MYKLKLYPLDVPSAVAQHAESWSVDSLSILSHEMSGLSVIHYTGLVHFVYDFGPFGSLVVGIE